MEFKEMITSTQLFWAVPTYNAGLLLILTLISVLMIVIGVGVWILLKKTSQRIPPYSELRNKLTSFFATNGIIGLLLAFFSWQSIPYLSSRILILILVLVVVIWLIVILVYLKRNFSWELNKFEQDERYKKYLPRPNRRGEPRTKTR